MQLPNPQRLTALLFLCSISLFANTIGAQPTTWPSTMPTTIPSDAVVDKAYPRYRMLKNMVESKKNKWRESENKRNATRARLSRCGCNPDANFSRQVAMLAAVETRKFAVDAEYKRLQTNQEKLLRVVAANTDTGEIVEAARADPRVQYLEHRLEDSEIRLLTAVETKSPTTVLEAQRDAIAKRLETVLTARKKEVREQLLQDGERRIALVKAEYDELNVQIDILFDTTVDMQAELRKYRKELSYQENLDEQISELEREIEGWDIRVFRPRFEYMWQSERPTPKFDVGPPAEPNRGNEKK